MLPRRGLRLEPLEPRDLLSFMAPPNYDFVIPPDTLGNRLAFGLAVGDFNGDGLTDLVTAGGVSSSPGVVSVLLGNGDGSFRAPVSFQVGSDPHTAAVADFNSDGRLDVATANTE